MRSAVSSTYSGKALLTFILFFRLGASDNLHCCNREIRSWDQVRAVLPGDRGCRVRRETMGAALQSAGRRKPERRHADRLFWEALHTEAVQKALWQGTQRAGESQAIPRSASTDGTG